MKNISVSHRSHQLICNSLPILSISVSNNLAIQENCNDFNLASMSFRPPFGASEINVDCLIFGHFSIPNNFLWIVCNASTSFCGTDLIVTTETGLQITSNLKLVSYPTESAIADAKYLLPF